MYIARYLRTVLTGVVAATAMSMSSIAFAQSESIAITLSPDFNYSAICVPRERPKLLHDWTRWDGVTELSSLDDMFSDALLYLNGNPGMLRDRPLALRMLQYLADSSWVNRSAALYHLGRTYLDKASGSYDPAQAIDKLKQAVELNHIGAAAYLGRAYQLGELLPKDILLAKRYLQVAAQNNDTSALLNLVKLYYEEPQLADKPDDAQTLLKAGLTTVYAAIAAGNCSELNTIGNIFSDNDLNVEDPQKAFAWYEAAYRTGDLEAAVQLANAYVLGRGVEYDVNEAINLLTVSAKSGRISSMISLAKLELANLDGPARRQDAEAWLSLAADNKELAAFTILAELADGKYGDAPKPDVAFNYLLDASQLPDVGSDQLIALADRYLHGIGTTADEQKAFAIYGRAAEVGAADGFIEQYRLTRGNAGLTNENPMALLRSAANLGQPEAMSLMSDAYRCGIGIEENAKFAERWRERAASSGYPSSLLDVANDAASRGQMDIYFRNIRRIAVDSDGEAMALLSQAYRLGLGTAKDSSKAQRWMDRALADPTTRSEALLASARIDLLGTFGDPVNLESAFQKLSEADALGNTSATYEMARLELEGFPGHAADRERAIALYVSAAQRGHLAAMTRLAELNVTRGEGGGTQASEWLAKASAGGNLRALLMQAESITDMSGRRVFYDRALAMRLCNAKDLVSLAAALVPDKTYSNDITSLLDTAVSLDPRDPGTLYQLGQMIRSGVVGTETDTDAIPFFRKAAEGGKVEAMRELGQSLVHGEGVARDLEQGQTWLLRAAEAGDSDAAEELADLVGSQADGTADFDAIINGLKSASKDGNTSTTLALARILSQLSLSNDAYAADAITWLQRAADSGDGASMLQLANAYALGLSVPRSAEDSAKWLKAAAEAGYVEAYPRYAAVLQMGLGVTSDVKAAKYWLEKAQTDGALN